MTDYAVPVSPVVSLPVVGTTQRFPVHRAYCVGQNYADHSREMGGDPTREPPFFFSKPADAIVESGGGVRFPGRTSNLHHEIELVVALARGGENLPLSSALDCVYGYAVGNDLTRRDLQAAAKKAGRPWDTAKGFDSAGVVGAIQPVSPALPNPLRGRIWLAVNGSVRQEGDLSQMIWNVAEIIAELSTYYALRAGDLIFTGTPAGVGALQRGDRVDGGIDGIGVLTHTLI